MKQYYKWINTARGIGMILVVLGHALADTLTGSGGILSKTVFNVIYSFHMPLFFFLSGFCGVRALDTRNLQEKGEYIAERFKRLMIPYFFIGLLYVPLKIFMAGEVNTAVNLKTLPLDFLTGINPNYQLWTLYALFVIAAIICLCGAHKGTHKWLLLIAGILCVVSTVVSCPIPIIQYVLETFFFYLLGLLYRRYGKTHGLSTPNFVAGAILFVLFNIVKEISGWEFLHILTGITGIIVVCELCKCLETKKTPILDCIGKYSMDIYIMANIVQVFVRSVLQNRLQVLPIICCLLSTVLGLVIPILISKFVVRKVKIFQCLILGDFSVFFEKRKNEGLGEAGR